MALPPLAAVSDLAAWVGQEIPDEDPRAGAVLSASSALVRAYTSETWVEDDVLTDVPDVVVAVVVQVAGRVWRNPEGVTSRSSGPFSERYADAVSSGLFLTTEEKNMLAEFVQAASTGLGTLGTTRGDAGYDTVYVPTGPAPSGYPFPWYAADGY